MTRLYSWRATPIGAVAWALVPMVLFVLTSLTVVGLTVTIGSFGHAAVANVIAVAAVLWLRPRVKLVVGRARWWPCLSALELAPSSEPEGRLAEAYAAAEQSLILARWFRSAGHAGVAERIAHGVPGVLRHACRLATQHAHLLVLPGNANQAAARRCDEALGELIACLDRVRLRMSDAGGSEALARAGLDDAARTASDAGIDADAYAKVAEGALELTRSVS